MLATTRSRVAACWLAIATCGGCSHSGPDLDVAESYLADAILLGPKDEAAVLQREQTQLAQTFFSVQDSRIFGNPPPIPKALGQQVSRVTQRVSAAAHQDISVEVLDCDAMVAFADFGGELSLCRGLLLDLEYEDELAFVLAHEYAHDQLGHTRSVVEEEDAQRRRFNLGRSAARWSGRLTNALFGFGQFLVGADPNDDYLPRVSITRTTSGEGESSGVDELLQAAGAFGAMALGYVPHRQIIAVSDANRARTLAAEGGAVRRLAPQQEFLADAAAFELTREADYAGGAGSYLLGTASDPVGANRGTPAFGPQSWNLLALAYDHPAASERISRLNALEISTVSPRPTRLDLCASHLHAEQESCGMWLEAVGAGDRLGEELVIIARSAVVSDAGMRLEHCRRSETILARTFDALGSDRGLAVTAGYFSLLCPGETWGKVALAPMLTEEDGGYWYWRQMSDLLFLKGRPGEAYDLASFMAERAGENAVAYSDFMGWASQSAVPELTSTALRKCLIVTREIFVADRGRFCRELAAPNLELMAQSRLRHAIGASATERRAMLKLIDPHRKLASQLERDEVVQLENWLIANSGARGPQGVDSACFGTERISVMALEREVSIKTIWARINPGCIFMPGLNAPGQKPERSPQTPQ